MAYTVLLDDATRQSAILLSDLQGVDTLEAASIASLDEYLRQGWAAGRHVFMAADYELGAALMQTPARASGSLKLYWFAQKTMLEGHALSHWLNENAQDAPAGFGAWTREITHDDYVRDVIGIQEAIARGEFYQINYTFRQHASAYGAPRELYARVRRNQPVAHGVCAHLPQGWILGFSPELFLRFEGDTVITEPMKGTAVIHADEPLDSQAQALREDIKNRAENIMIVDLLRNDLGKLAKPGDVRVPEIFAVRPYGQVLQMTSRIEARLPEGTSLAAIFQAAFPCGSITGAPKKASMRTIQALERSARGAYTGSMGHLMPTDAGFSGSLNVAIRTVTLKTTDHPHYFDATVGVGSGIVADSEPEAEWRECGWKTRFLAIEPEFGLIETLRLENGRCALIAEHGARMRQAAQELGFSWSEDAFHDALKLPAKGAWRVRLLLEANGLSVDAQPLADRVLTDCIIHSKRLPRQDYLRRFKTTRRASLDAAWRQAEEEGAFDALLFNTDDILLEGARTSVFILLDGQWLSPSLALDILPGVMRAQLFRQPQLLNASKITEAHITLEDVRRAETIVLGNALRGFWRAKLKSVK